MLSYLYIGFKKIKGVKFPKILQPGLSLKERIAKHRKRQLIGSIPLSENWENYNSTSDKFDEVDHLLDLHGHIIGMGLSPDHRYVFITKIKNAFYKKVVINKMS